MIERNKELEKEIDHVSEEVSNLKQLLVAETIRRQAIADEFEESRRMGRQPSNSMKGKSPKLSKPKPRANNTTVKSLVDTTRPSDMLQENELISDGSSNNAPHMMNVPEDDEEPPTFGGKKAKHYADDMEFTKEQAREIYKEAAGNPMNQSGRSSKQLSVVISNAAGEEDSEYDNDERNQALYTSFEEDDDGGVDTLQLGRSSSMARKTKHEVDRKKKAI